MIPDSHVCVFQSSRSNEELEATKIICILPYSNVTFS